MTRKDSKRFIETLAKSASISDNFKVIVTGSQRAGTTITARIIAEECGIEFVPEERFEVGKKAMFIDLLKEKGAKQVIQCPTMSAFVHEDEIWKNAIFIIHMQRSYVEIEASARRVNWMKYDLSQLLTVAAAAAKVCHEYEWGNSEVARVLQLAPTAYDLPYTTEHILEQLKAKQWRSWQAKLAWWYWQKQRIEELKEFKSFSPTLVTFPYNNLQDHNLFKPKNERANFHARQTE